MRNISRIVVVVSIEYIMLHSGFILLFIVTVLFFKGHADHSVYDFLLLIGKGVEYFLYGLFVICVLCFVSHLRCVLLFSIV